MQAINHHRHAIQKSWLRQSINHHRHMQFKIMAFHPNSNMQEAIRKGMALPPRSLFCQLQNKQVLIDPPKAAVKAMARQLSAQLALVTRYVEECSQVTIGRGVEYIHWRCQSVFWYSRQNAATAAGGQKVGHNVADESPSCLFCRARNNTQDLQRGVLYRGKSHQA